MNIIKINSGKVELCKDSGSLIRTIGNGDAVQADINSDGFLVLITTVKGKVGLRKESELILSYCLFCSLFARFMSKKNGILRRLERTTNNPI